MGDARGPVLFFLALLPAGGLAVERCLKEQVSKLGHRVVCPPHQHAGIAKPAAWIEGVLNAGTTTRTSVVSHGSAWKRSGGRG